MGDTKIDVPAVLRDAVYVGVGFGLITFQKAQVRRREIQAQLDRLVKDLSGQDS